MNQFRTILLLTFFTLPFCNAQTVKGIVLDANSQQPIETATIYFDNTTIGTVTNSKGEFVIPYNAAVKGVLVISYLGYQTAYITDYRNVNSLLTVALHPAKNELDEVVISYDDGLTRKQKLKLFRQHFLGTSKYGKSCEIYNEDAIILRYNATTKTLSANTTEALQIYNKALGYSIIFNITEFYITFYYVDSKTNTFKDNKVIYYGTNFYTDSFKNRPKKRILRRRNKAYKGSVQHFMRALYYKTFEADGYIFGKRGFKVNPYAFFEIYNTDNLGYKTILLKEKLDIFYKSTESVIQTTSPKFTVDKFGNYAPIQQVLFSGDMAQQRIGDALPLDFKANTL